MDSQSARLWMAMGIGPLWIGRDDEDPLSPAAIMREESRSEVQTLPTRSTEKPSTQSNEDTQAVFVKQEAGEVTKVMVTPAFGVKKVLPQSILGAQQPPEPQRLQSPGSAKPNLASLSPIPLPLDSPGMVTQKPCSDEVIAKASWDELRQCVGHGQAGHWRWSTG